MDFILSDCCGIFGCLLLVLVIWKACYTVQSCLIWNSGILFEVWELSVIVLWWDGFVEKVSASVSTTSFLLVASVLFYLKCLRGASWIFPEIFRIIFQIVFVLVEELRWLTEFCLLMLWVVRSLNWCQWVLY